MWGIIKSNLRHNKVGVGIVIFFIMITMFLLTVGLTIMVQIDVFLTDKIIELNEADVEVGYYMGNDEAMREQFEQRAVDYAGIEDYHKMSMYMATKMKMQSPETSGGQEGDNVMFNKTFIPMDEMGEQKLNIDDETIRADGYPIYINSIFRNHLEVKVGDKYIFYKNGESLEMYVAGFVNTLNRMQYSHHYYVPDSSYRAIKAFDGEQGGHFGLILINVNSTFKTAGLNNYYSHIKSATAEIKLAYGDDIINSSGVRSYGMDNSFGVMSIRQSATTISVPMLVFSLLIAIVGMIVIRFVIVANIEDNIKNIGVLKASGYQTRDLRKAYAIQYLIMTVVAIVLGLVLAYATINLFSQIVSLASSVTLALNVDILMVLASIAIIATMIGAVLFITTHRISKIEPIMALRKGVATHSFKRNWVRLDNAKVSNNVALALKSIANGKRQSIMIVVVIMIMTVVASFTSVVFYNMHVNTDALLPVLGVESNDASITFQQEEHLDLLENELVADYNSTMSMGNTVVFSNKASGNMLIVEDFTKMRVDPSYIGRMPLHANEIAISSIIKQMLGKSVGQFIELESQGVVQEYLISGITQGINMNNYVSITMAGYLTHYPETSHQLILSRASRHIYLNEGVTVEEYKAFVDNKGYAGVVFYDQQDNLLAIGAMTKSADMVLIVMILIVVLVVLMQVVMVVHMQVTREKQHIAINKSLGYRSRDISLQMMLSMAILVIIGTVIGSLVGALLTSSLMQAALSGYGVMQVMFSVNWWYILAIALVVPAFTVMLTGITSLTVARISPARLKAN